MIIMPKVYVTYVIKPIAEKSPIFGLFFIHKIDNEVILECMEIVGKEHKIFHYIRASFF